MYGGGTYIFSETGVQIFSRSPDLRVLGAFLEKCRALIVIQAVDLEMVFSLWLGKGCWLFSAIPNPAENIVLGELRKQGRARIKDHSPPPAPRRKEENIGTQRNKWLAKQPTISSPSEVKK